MIVIFSRRTSRFLTSKAGAKGLLTRIAAMIFVFISFGSRYSFSILFLNIYFAMSDAMGVMFSAPIFTAEMLRFSILFLFISGFARSVRTILNPSFSTRAIKVRVSFESVTFGL